MKALKTLFLTVNNTSTAAIPAASGMPTMANTFTYVVSINDVDSLIINDSHDGSVVDNINVKIKVNTPSTTGIKNIEKIEFKAFPNPIVNELNIQSTGKLGNVIVTNIAGQIVFEKSFEDENTKIDFSNFDAGVYVVCAGNTKQKFIKQ